MYHADIVQQRLEIAEATLGRRIEYHSVSEVQEFERRLKRRYEDVYEQAEAEAAASQDPSRTFQLHLQKELNQPKAPKLTSDEVRWMQNEQYLVQCDAAYWLTRYYYIKTPNRIQLFTFLPGQRIYFDVIAELEKRRAPIEMIINKARQHGVSTQTEGLICHATCFTHGVNAVIASADRNMTAKMSQMTFLGYDMMPWWIKPIYSRRVESNQGMLVFGGMKAGVSFQHGNQMSAIARGDTIVKYHLSECASYADASTLIEAGLFKCVHAHPSVFGILESTAEGDTGWWYDTYWHSKSQWKRGRSRLCPLFLPWFLATDKYPTPTWEQTHPIPQDWRPSPETRQMTALAKLYVGSNSVLEKVLGLGWTLPRTQQWFWEVNFEEHRAKGKEKLWFQEMPTDDKQSFQGSYDNVFGREVIAEVWTQRKVEYWAFGLTGQSIEDRHEPDPEDVSYEESRVPVVWKSPKGDTFRWELIPLMWREPWSSLEEVGDYEDQNGVFFVWEKPQPGYDYSIGIDTSSGLGGDGDDTCIAVCRRAKNPTEPDVQVAEFRSDKVSHVEAYAFGAAITAYYAKHMGTTMYRHPYVAIEQIAAVGDTCQLQMRKMGFSRFHQMVRYDDKKIQKSKSHKSGWFTTGWSRPMLTDGFVVSVQNGWYIINSPRTIWEMEHWEVHLTGSGKEKKEHSSEATDDGIFANAMATFCPSDLKSMTERTTKRGPGGPRGGGNDAIDWGQYSGVLMSTRVPKQRMWR